MFVLLGGLTAAVGLWIFASRDALIEKLPAEKPKHKIAIGYATVFFEDGGRGNLVKVETLNGKLHIEYTQVKEPPFAGYLSYAISIYDFNTQIEKIVNLPLIEKSAHVYEDGLHLIPELSQYTLDPSLAAPDGFTYNEESAIARKGDKAYSLTPTEYLYLTENMMAYYPKSTLVYDQSPHPDYTAGRYKIKRLLDGKFLGWVIEEE
jgi:hypothetical protein